MRTLVRIIRPCDILLCPAVHLTPPHLTRSATNHLHPLRYILCTPFTSLQIIFSLVMVLHPHTHTKSRDPPHFSASSGAEFKTQRCTNNVNLYRRSFFLKQYWCRYITRILKILCNQSVHDDTPPRCFWLEGN